MTLVRTRTIPHGHRQPSLISIVSPVYNEAASLPRLLEALERELRSTGRAFEVVLVDDRSADDSFAVMSALRTGRPWLKLIRFSRNFGKEVALAAGLGAAQGEVVIQMDSDLQHPPAMIHDFLAAWAEGADIVYGARDRAAERGSLRDRLTRLFYGLFDRVAEIQLMPGGGDFALFDRKVVDVLNQMPERNRFGKGLYAWVGFERRAIPYVPAERHAGRSSFNPVRLIRLAVDGLTSFSILPLRVWTLVGGAVSLLSFAFGAWIVVQTLLWGTSAPGYPSVMVGIAFLGGIQLITLGVIGEYLGQVYMEVKRRPLYVVDARVGFGAGETARSADTSAATI